MKHSHTSLFTHASQSEKNDISLSQARFLWLLCIVYFAWWYFVTVNKLDIHRIEMTGIHYWRQIVRCTSVFIVNCK